MSVLVDRDHDRNGNDDDANCDNRIELGTDVVKQRGIDDIKPVVHVFHPF